MGVEGYIVREQRGKGGEHGFGFLIYWGSKALM